MSELEYFTVTCNGIGAIQIDYVDLNSLPDEEIVYAFVDFEAREEPGTVHWLSGLTPPRGIQLDKMRGRFASEDGKLRTIIGAPENEKQVVTATGTPITLTYAGQTTASFANTATPPQVQTALENLSNIAVGDVYVTGAIANEKQTVSFTGGPTGGTFLLLYDGDPTTPISRNASASAMQAALQAIDAIGSEGVSVTGPTGGPWIVEFTGNHAGVNMNTLTSSPRSEVQTITVTGTPTGGQFKLTYSGQTTAEIAYNASAATVQAALIALSNIGPSDVVVTGDDGGPWTVAFGGALANQNVALITSVPETNEIQTVTITGTPTGGSFTLTYDGQTTAPITRYAAAATVRNALQALPNIAQGDVAVSGGGFIGEGPWTVKFQGTLGNLSINQMTATASLTPAGGVTVATTTQGLGVIGGTVTTATTMDAVFLTPSGSATIATTVTGSAGTPWTVNFIGTLEATDVAQMTATNATVTTTQTGTGDLGVKLVANTAVMEIDGDLIYDVTFVVPDLDPLREDRVITPFAIAAPTVGGVTVDLADSTLHLPPKPL